MNTSSVGALERFALFIKPVAIVSSIFGLIFIGFMLGNAKMLLPATGDTVSVGKLASMLKNKDRQPFTLINVHTPYEGEIERTDALVASDTIVEQSAILPKDKTAPVILYCKSGEMSQEALGVLKSMGYTNVRHLSGGFEAWQKSGNKLLNLTSVEEAVLPKQGVTLPVSWGSLGTRLVREGVINYPEFKKAVRMTPQQEAILTSESDEKITINAENAQFVVDVLWALGLAQKSIVYTDGPLGKEYAARQGDFASTGGWTLARGDAIRYLNRLDLIPLTAEQHMKVADIAKHVYRPCCGNSTWFPDCNHGMAALAVIELLVSANIAEQDIYRYMLGFNSFWFPDSYLTTATYFARRGVAWDAVDPKEILGERYSSGKGAGEIASKVGPLPNRPQSGGSCGT